MLSIGWHVNYIRENVRTQSKPAPPSILNLSAPLSNVSPSSFEEMVKYKWHGSLIRFAHEDVASVEGLEWFDRRIA